MDIKEQISKMTDAIKNNPDIKEQFEKEPVKAIESIIGIDLPDDIVETVIDGVKANLTVDSISKFADGIKKLF